MAGNFVNMRYGLGWVLGLQEQDPNNDLFFQGKALDENIQYPTLADLKKTFMTSLPKYTKNYRKFQMKSWMRSLK
jgi:hypothetical protein